jgi:hypothetical protein
MFDHDIGSQVAVVNAYTLALTSAAAGLTTSSTASQGEPVDRTTLTGNYHSVKSVVSLFSRAASTSGNAYPTVGLRLEESDSSGGTYTAHTTEVGKVIGCTSESAALNSYCIHSQDIDLGGAKRWIRQVVTITKVATSSADTLQAEGLLIFGGPSVLPAT